MSKSNAFENLLLEHILNNAAIANVGDAGGLQPSAADGDLWISLHTADPTEAGTQTSSEATYTGYQRIAIARDGSEWTVTGNQGENTNAAIFDPCTAGSNTITHFGVGTLNAGAGTLLYSGALSAPLAVSAGIIPQFAAGDLTITED